MQTFKYDRTLNMGHLAYKFTGKERDQESGLDYFGYRHWSLRPGSPLPARTIKDIISWESGLPRKVAPAGNRTLVCRPSYSCTSWRNPLSLTNLF